MPPELDLVDWPADRTVAVSGLAGSLRLPLTLKNASSRPTQVTELSLAEVRLAGKGAALSARPAPVRLEVASGGVARTELKLRLDPQTPPGRYEGKVQVAGL